jgi:hypothetical protein
MHGSFIVCGHTETCLLGGVFYPFHKLAIIPISESRLQSSSYDLPITSQLFWAPGRSLSECTLIRLTAGSCLAQPKVRSYGNRDIKALNFRELLSVVHFPPVGISGLMVSAPCLVPTCTQIVRLLESPELLFHMGFLP